MTRVYLHSCDPWCTWRTCADVERAHEEQCRDGVVTCAACDYLASQDPQDAQDRLAHDLPYDATDGMLCRRGCGLDYRAIYSGKVGHCPAWPFPPHDFEEVPEPAFDAWMEAWHHIGLVNAIVKGWRVGPPQLVSCRHEDMGRYRDERLQALRRIAAFMDLPAPLVIDLNGPPCIDHAFGWPYTHRCGEFWCPRHGSPTKPKDDPDA